MPKLPTISPAVPGVELGQPDVLLDRAVAAHRDGRREEANQLYRRCLRIDPTNLKAINRLGVLASETSDPTTALRQFANALAIDPNQPETWFNRGVVQSRLGLNEDALKSFNRTIALTPLSGPSHLQRAAALVRLGRYDQAVTAFDETVRLLPRDPLTANVHAVALQWNGDRDQALKEFDRAIALDPGFAEAMVEKAHLLLLLGDLPGGFALYERRWNMAPRSDVTRRQYERPLWLGDSNIAGKTILLHREQGLGDVIQFCRYTTLAANAGARVIVEAPASLVTLLTTLPGVSRVIAAGDPLPDHDLRCPMMSLPLAFGTTHETIPANVPYLHANPGRMAAWRDRLSHLKGRRVGLVWGAGSRLGDAELVATEQRKSLPLAALAPLASVAGCDFVSIQLGPAARLGSPPPGLTLHDHTAELNDFSDTAALMENLDLVISVCTSTVHLAGALGRPVWLLNRFDTDWRWFLGRIDSPWYPTMRIFRQPCPGDWTSVVHAVAEELRAFVAI